MKLLTTFLLLLLLVTSFAFIVNPVFAQEENTEEKQSWLEGNPLLPENCTKKLEPGENQIDNCGLNEVTQVIINIARIILLVTGSVALLMFAYGGTMFIIAAGQQERVAKAKQILVAATIGIIIILGAWLIVNTVIVALQSGAVGGEDAINQVLNGSSESLAPQNSDNGCCQNSSSCGGITSQTECNAISGNWLAGWICISQSGQCVPDQQRILQ